MKKTRKLAALLLSAAVCAAQMPVSAAHDAIYVFCGGITLAYVDTTGEWFDYSTGALLTDSTEPLQSARYEGVQYTVDLVQMSVYTADGTVNDALTALLPEYLAFRPLAVSDALGWEMSDGAYTCDLSEAERFAAAEQLVQTIPLTYQFDSTMDDFCCRISLGGERIGGMHYSIDAGDALEAVPWQRENGVIVKNLGNVPTVTPTETPGAIQTQAFGRILPVPNDSFLAYSAADWYYSAADEPVIGGMPQHISLTVFPYIAPLIQFTVRNSSEDALAEAVTGYFQDAEELVPGVQQDARFIYRFLADGDQIEVQISDRSYDISGMAAHADAFFAIADSRFDLQSYVYHPKQGRLYHGWCFGEWWQLSSPDAETGAAAVSAYLAQAAPDWYAVTEGDLIGVYPRETIAADVTFADYTAVLAGITAATGYRVSAVHDMTGGEEAPEEGVKIYTPTAETTTTTLTENPALTIPVDMTAYGTGALPDPDITEDTTGITAASDLTETTAAAVVSTTDALPQTGRNAPGALLLMLGACLLLGCGLPAAVSGRRRTKT